jgi:uncharacterized membrane protein YcjF (UPF0283 family)
LKHSGNESDNEWHLLHRLLGSDKPFEAFQKAFVQKYYPEKAYLLKLVVKQTSTKSESQNQVSVQRPTKKCPYCAEIILAEAKFCRFCSRDLTRNPPEEISRKRVELTEKLAGLEKTLVTWEQYLQEQDKIEDKAQSQITWALIGMIVGIFLIPVGIGVLLVLAGLLAAITQRSKRNKARKNQSKARHNIGVTRKKIIEVKAALADLQ